LPIFTHPFPLSHSQLETFSASAAKHPGKSTLRDDSPASSPGTPLETSIRNSPLHSRKRRRITSNSPERSGSSKPPDSSKPTDTILSESDSEGDEPLANTLKLNGADKPAGARVLPGQGGRSIAAGKGAGKGKGREPVSVVRKEGEDVVVDENGKTLHKAGLSVGHAEDEAKAKAGHVRGDVDVDMDVNDRALRVNQNEAAAEVVNRLTQGVTVDVEKEMESAGIAPDVDVEEIEDWDDLVVVSRDVEGIVLWRLNRVERIRNRYRRNRRRKSLSRM
jgi:hypothetical protein